MGRRGINIESRSNFINPSDKLWGLEYGIINNYDRIKTDFKSQRKKPENSVKFLYGNQRVKLGGDKPIKVGELPSIMTRTQRKVL